MKNLFTRFIAFSMILLSYASIAQTTHTVEAGMFYYEPQNLTIEVGDIVSWNNLAGTHDVNFDVNSITGESFGNPDNTSLAANSGGDLGSITFTEPGTYTYDCSIGSHASNGMVGTITVAAAPSNVSGIVFSGVFGGSLADGNTYTVPSGSDSWAGFANEDASVYPFTFGEGGSITFSASAASPAEIYFKFEKNPYPDTEPSFPSETISLSTETANYTVEIPSQGGNTFSSFLLYVSSNDVAVTLNNVVVNTSDYSGPVDVVGCMDSNASNFNADATAAGQDQYGNSVCVYASCDDIPTWGCIYVDGFGAFNEGFDAAACSSYGGTPCEEPISDLAACTDQDACNYNSAATSDDGSCNYPSPGYNCDFEFIGCPDGTDNYALNAYDSGNDGWGNSLMYAYFDGVLQVDDQISSMFGVDYTYKLALQFSQGCMPDIFNGGAYENCATHTLQFCVDQSVECMQFVVTTDDMTSINSSDPSEVSWEFLNPDGDIVSSGGAGSSTSVGPCDPIEPQFTFSGTFGGSSFTGTEYMIPSGSESWAGFANLDLSIYPLIFEDGGSITFNASSSEETAIYFKFEYNPHPDTEPSFNTDTISLNNEESSYTVNIPSQGDNTYSSFLMYIVDQDVSVSISDLELTTSGTINPSTDISGCMDENASNYDANATLAGQDQYGNSVCVYASCDDIPEYGCIYADGFGAFNESFDAVACESYGGTPCSEPTGDITGCMDMNASNYNAAATIAGEDEYGNSTCIYASCDDIPEYGCIYADGFGAFNDEFNAAQCSGYGGTPCSEPTDDIAGCMDMNATNYDANATVAGEDQYGNSTCIYASCDDIPTWGCIYVDGFGTFNPEFGDDLCVTYGGTPCVEPTDEIEGCMDENATNYDANATAQDYDQYGNLKCIYTSCDDIPEYGCIYADGFGAFNAEFGAEACTGYGGTPCSEPTDAILGCMDANASNYEATATEQSFDQYGNLNCLFESCDAIPQPGCIYPNGFGLFNAEFGPEECSGYGGNPCGEYQSVRYQDEIFTEVTVTENVQYGANIGIITQAPVLENLMMDVYEPTGDTETDRPVVVMLHTGSFLPAIANGQPTGDKSDFAIVEACKNYARRGYVAVAVNYRLGWNPVSTSEDVRRSTLIQAAYRGLQDTKTAVRFLRKSAAEDGNPYGVGEQFVVGGYGTGGYLSLAMATLNDYDSELLMPKFIDSSQETIDEFGQPMPYIIPSVLGNFEATDNAMICVANHVGYSSEVDMVFNAGGALPDISWLDAGEVPIASMQNILDPDAPYAEGNVIVPTTGEFVIVAHGSQIVQETANAYGNNDVFDGMSTTLNDAWYGNGNGAENAAAAGHDDLPGLFGMVTPAPSAAPTVCGMQTVQNAPWDAWDNAMYDAMASVYQGQPAGVMGCLATLGNPDMSEEKALAMLDMMDEFFAPRIAKALDLIQGPARYKDEIFTEVTVTENVQYGANIGIITQAPVLENLMMDVYEPTGDTETDRPVVVMLHTGSFLPAIANGQPTGDKSDFAIVEACKNYARRGYVAVAVNYRLGWNPVSTSEDVRRSTLIQAAYRGLQDTKTAVRFLRKSAAEDGNPYGVGEQFVVGGYGTGGYLSLAMATLNDYDSELLMPKFIDSSQETIDEFGQPMPYIIPSVLGNFEATDNAMICVANHVGYSSEVDMVFNAGGALPDISWLDAGEVPIASMQNILDPDAPYAEGNVIVPTTGEFVIVAHGSQIVQETANAYGNNDVFDGMSTTLNDAWYGNGNGAENAAAAGHDDLPGLFGMVTPAPSAAPTVCGMQTVQNAPWDAWDNAMYDAMASVYQGQPAGVMGCLATLGNPDMSEEKALAMLDMMDEFFAPRIDAALSTPSSDVDNEGPTSQTIELPSGWSMFSTYMTASDMAFDAVVSSIVDNVTIAKDYNGSAYLPEYFFNGIGNMELGQGYQIKTDEAVTLTVGGSYNAPEANPIALVQGWNMIGYLRLQPADASLVLADLTAQSIIEIAKDYNGSAFLPEYSFNGIGDFEAGRGYQVKTTEAATLTLNANGSDYNRTVALKTTFNKTNHFEQAVNTGSNMTITIPNDAWEVSPTIGDEIAAYNANGILVGSAKYTSPVTVLTVWGNDATTNTVDGLVNAEGMRFKVWNKRYNSTDELVVKNWIEGSNAYEVNAVNQIGQIGYVSNSVNSSTFGLYPVPANKELNLDLTLDLSQDVTVTLYNLIGKVMNVATYSLEKGLNTVLLDVETLKDGTYLCKVLTNNGEITRKFNVIK